MTLLDEPVVRLEPEPDLPPRGLLVRVLPVLVVFALLGLIGTAGTWAAFSASTDNAASLVTGSLVLSNTVTGQVGSCLSSDDAGLDVNSSQCEQLFAASAQQPGDEVGETLVLENAGDLDAATFSLYAPGACASSTAAETHTGTGTPADICSLLQLVVQEYTDSGFGTAVSSCVYPADANAACAFDAGSTVDDFVGSHGSFGSALAITGGLDAAEARYFRVAVTLDPSAGNSVQGRAAAFSLTWRIEQ